MQFATVRKQAVASITVEGAAGGGTVRLSRQQAFTLLVWSCAALDGGAGPSHGKEGLELLAPCDPPIQLSCLSLRYHPLVGCLLPSAAAAAAWGEQKLRECCLLQEYFYLTQTAIAVAASAFNGGPAGCRAELLVAPRTAHPMSAEVALMMIAAPTNPPLTFAAGPPCSDALRRVQEVALTVMAAFTRGSTLDLSAPKAAGMHVVLKAMGAARGCSSCCHWIVGI